MSLFLRTQITIIIILLVSLPLCSEIPWQWQTPKPHGYHLNSIEYIEWTDELIAVGEAGNITKTSLNNTEWDVSFLEEDLLQVLFINQLRGYIISSGEKLYQSDDGGQQWQELNLLDGFVPRYINFVDQDLGFVAGSYTYQGNLKIFRTTNGGDEWVEIYTHYYQSLDIKGINFVNETIGFVYGGENSILRTDDGGLHWGPIAFEYGEVILSTSFITSSTGFAVGYNAQIDCHNLIIWKTIDSGMNWTVNHGEYVYPREIEFFGSMQGLCAAEEGRLLYTGDGGSSWQEISLGTHNNINSIDFGIDGNCYLSGDGGLVMKSGDYGQNWQQMSEGISQCITDIEFINNTTAVAVAFEGKILRTENNGDSWQEIESGITEDLETLHFIDEYTGFAAGAGSCIIKTVDGGETWGIINDDIQYAAEEVYFFDEQNGLLSGNGYIMYTTDGGQSWTDSSIPGTGYPGFFSSIDFANSTTGFAVGSNGRLLKTTNRGVTWTDIDSGHESWLHSVHFVDDQLGFICGQLGVIMRTEDGGETWYTIVDQGLIRFRDIRFFDNECGIAVGNRGNLYFTATSGDMWDPCILEAPRDLECVAFSPSGLAYIGGSFGTIMANSLVQGIENDKKLHPKQNNLNSKAWPNPFNPQTSISFDLKSDAEVSLSIFNVKGQLVKELLHNESLVMGGHTVAWDGKNSSGITVSSGVYYYRVVAGENTETKRMILMK